MARFLGYNPYLEEEERAKFYREAEDIIEAVEKQNFDEVPKKYQDLIPDIQTASIAVSNFDKLAKTIEKAMVK